WSSDVCSSDLVVQLGGDGPGRGAVRAQHHAAVLAVRAEDPVRVRVLAPHERVELCGCDLHSSSNRRRIPATGIGTQSGRLSSSYCSSYTAFSSSKIDSRWLIAASPAGSRLASTVSR